MTYASASWRSHVGSTPLSPQRNYPSALVNLVTGQQRSLAGEEHDALD
jgi:hypothetical protein